tara:strand:- start:2655 stop:3407 length:753 start_codon:yes stop_codon:yes gene_type:complete
MDTNNEFLIYGLADPVSNEIRYIGKSTSGSKRPKEHLHKCKSKREFHTYKARWIKKLIRNGLSYKIVILEILCDNDHDLLLRREQDWIKLGREAGWPLTNLSDGGTGMYGLKHSQKTKRKMSLAHKGKPSKLKGRKMPESTKKKLSKANKGKKPSDKCIAASIEWHTGRKLSKDHKQKLHEGMKNYKHSYNVKIQIAKSKGMRQFVDHDGETHDILATAAYKYGISRGYVRNILAGIRKSKEVNFCYVEK